jgi:uncharacterized membrane protein YjgN (DUF898 family)
VKRFRLVCRLGFGDVLFQLIGWTVLALITLGLALPFFAYYFVKLFIDHTEIQEVSA